MAEAPKQTNRRVNIDNMDAPRWDAFTELASTMADELFPTAIPLNSEWPAVTCRNIVNFLLTDGDMRGLLEGLLVQTPRSDRSDG